MRQQEARPRGSYENDRPPIVGSVGRQTGEVRLRVQRHTDQKTLVGHVHGYTAIESTLYTDENGALRRRSKGSIGRSLTA